MITANIAPTKVVPAATTLTPYYDDFDEDKNFHRFLFRPGYAVQARELTGLQTMLQNQIERFGNHIFQNGSLVLGGQITMDTSVVYLNLQTTYANSSINVGAFSQNTITYGSGNAVVRAHVFGARAAVGTAPPTLVIKYLTGDEFGADTVIKAGDEYANTAIADHTGRASIASINDGIFYINGYFVKVPSQTVILDKYTPYANVKVGLEYSEDIIDENDDSTLLDPAQESSNYQAPGAARLQVNFDLTTRTLDTEDEESFVEIMRVENGIIKKQVKTPTYSVIGDTLARRTFDESGSYTVRRFLLSVQDHATDNTKLSLVLDPGKAYIKGYEYENISQEILDLDKARDTKAATYRAHTLSVGNYLNVQNVSNTFDVSTMELTDLHAVNVNSINVSTALGYASSKVGTARVKEVRYNFRGTSTDSNTDIMSISLFDMRFANITSNVSASSANGIQLYDPTGKFSNTDGAYVGSTVRITSGSGAGEKHNIVRYIGQSRTINIAGNFYNAPTGGASGSGISLDLDFDSVKSLRTHGAYTPGATSNASANVHISSFESANGYTRLYEPERQTLLYRMSDRFVKANTITNQSYEYYKYLSAPTAFSAAGTTTIALASGENFYTTNDTTGVATTTLTGIAAYRTDNGKRINLSNVSISGDGQTASLAIPGEGATVPFKAYVRVMALSGSKTIQKSKILRSANTTHMLATGTSLNVATSAGTTNTKVKTDADNTGQAVITNPSGKPDEWMSLFMSDVKEISAIYDLDGAAIPAAGTSLTAYTDVIADFKFDNGQRSTHYDHAAITLRPSKGRKKGPLVVCFKWYEHTSGDSDGYGYFTVDSYTSPETYEGIPIFVDQDKMEYPLSDCIDFRPTRSNKSSTSPHYTYEEVRIPVNGTVFFADYDYYLPRKSYLAMTTDLSKPFKVLNGISAKLPIDPKLNGDSMLLYKLTLDPYTLTKSNVQVEFVENKRYTMRDIGRLETRIEHLEYYQLLSILETAANAMKILDANGLERTKYGILADSFSSQAYGDIIDDDYFVSIDTTESGMYPASNVAAIGLQLTSNTNTVLTGQSLTLKFTQTPAIIQNTATKWVPVQPYMVSQWVGAVEMDPPADNWIETKVAPEVVIQSTVNQSVTTDTKPNNPLALKAGAAKRQFALPVKRKR